ncbi:hypothetical protein IAT40_004597 [Kwoniella sp. CBS 6097]
MIIHPTPAPAHAEGSIYRLKRGTKLSELPPLPPNPPVPDLSSLNGPFQLAEYLSLKVRADPHDVRGLVDVPSGDKSVGGKGPDKDVWIYEHMRRIPIDLTPLVIALLPICNPTTCPEMKADEWLYLCSAHGGGAEQCSAIDYILHTLESTTGILNDPHNFPSRMQIPQASISRFPSLFRRLSRIFSHAYYHHRETFSLAEAETSLYARFLGLCEKYDLVGSNLLPIPRSAIVITKEEEEREDEEKVKDEDGEGSSEEEEGEDDNRGRGESAPIERRTQSLDRSLPPSTAESKQTRSPQKAEAGKAGTSTTAESTRSSSENEKGLPPNAKNMNVGRGTLGRGKQPRATMEWAKPPSAQLSTSTSADPIPPLPTPDSNSSSRSPITIKGRDRSESIESAIHMPSLEPPPEAVQDHALEDLEAESPQLSSNANANAGDDVEAEAGSLENPSTAAENVEEEQVPKDEIELLEEEGKLKPQTTVAPLAPPAQGESAPLLSDPQAKTTSGEAEAEEGDTVEDDGKEDMQEIELNEPTTTNPNPNPDSNVSANVEEEPTGTGETVYTEMASSRSSASPSSSKIEKKEKKLSPLREKGSGSPAPSPIKGKGKPSAAEVVKSDSTDNSTSTTASTVSTATTGSAGNGGDSSVSATAARAEEGEAMTDSKESK